MGPLERTGMAWAVRTGGALGGGLVSFMQRLLMCLVSEPDWDAREMRMELRIWALMTLRATGGLEPAPSCTSKRRSMASVRNLGNLGNCLEQVWAVTVMRATLGSLSILREASHCCDLGMSLDFRLREGEEVPRSPMVAGVACFLVGCVDLVSLHWHVRLRLPEPFFLKASEMYRRKISRSFCDAKIRV